MTLLTTGEPKPKNPAKLLAALMLVELGVDIEPTALAAFINTRWHRVAVCAHAIHDEDVAQQVEQSPPAEPTNAFGMAEFLGPGVCP